MLVILHPSALVLGRAHLENKIHRSCSVVQRAIGCGWRRDVAGITACTGGGTELEWQAAATASCNREKILMVV